jgi:hypothetical protein
MDWLVWDGLGRTWAGGRFELVQAGFGLVSGGGGGLVDKWVVRGPRSPVRFGLARVTYSFWEGFVNKCVFAQIDQIPVNQDSCTTFW